MPLPPDENLNMYTSSHTQLARIMRYLIELAAWKESMGLTTAPEAMNSFTRKLFSGFRLRIKEVKDMKLIMYEIKHHKREILEQIN
jgi:hypothetical protein